MLCLRLRSSARRSQICVEETALVLHGDGSGAAQPLDADRMVAIGFGKGVLVASG